MMAGRPFVAIEYDSGRNQANFLYHNNRNGTFTRNLSGSIGTDNEPSHCGAWGDYNNDGHLDLLVVNGFAVSARNSLYRNNGDGTFTKVTDNATGSIVTDTAVFLMGVWGLR
jgi:hypothetical protein